MSTVFSEAANDPDAFSPGRVGIHTSIAGSVDQSAERAHQLGCTAFQIFSSSPRMWKAREPAPGEIAALARLRARYDLSPLAIHTNYLNNLAAQEQVLRDRSIDSFRAEIARAVALDAEYLVLHPGSFRGASAEQGMRTLAASVRQANRLTPFKGVTLLIENTAGQGNVLGGTFDQLRDILALLDGLPVACCIDTAHCFAAGMDISTAAGLEQTLASLDSAVGLHRIPVIHTNDSRSPLGSHRDRHEHIGKGGIGLEGFRRIVNHPALRDKVFILETPIEAPGDDLRNMQAIRSLRVARKAAPLRRRGKPAAVASRGLRRPAGAFRTKWKP